VSYEVRQREVFEFEVRRAVDHYAVEAPQMLDIFFGELDATIARIAKFPIAPRVVRGSTRAIHLQAHFPYSVLYVVQEQLHLVDLTIFLHDRQDQQGLLPRLSMTLRTGSVTKRSLTARTKMPTSPSTDEACRPVKGESGFSRRRQQHLRQRGRLRKPHRNLRSVPGRHLVPTTQPSAPSLASVPA